MGLNKHVLVFPCGSEIGLELHRALSCAKEVVLFGANSEPDHGRYIYARYFETLPHIDAPDFIADLNALIQSNGIDYVYPAHDSAVLEFSRAQDQGQLACRAVVAPYETCRICRSKKVTMEFFRNELRTPILYVREEDVKNWPVFLKPDVGQGSKGTWRAANAELCRLFRQQNISLLMMEYLPGPEFTVDCFTNYRGELVFAQPRTRTRIMNGISVRTSFVDDPRLVQMAHIINNKMSFKGAWFFQVKLAGDGEPALMEIAPRIAGAMGLCRGAGVNLPLMSIYDAEGQTVSAMLNPSVKEMDRALYGRFHLDCSYRHIYVDLDDCLICNGEVNVDLIKFLFQCLNRGIKLHLLTRHASVPEETLSQYRLGMIFDTITHITDGSTKAQHIRYPDAIFIDDSFRERKSVYDALHIPVFAPDAVEVLFSSG
jgi:hypothetical protein